MDDERQLATPKELNRYLAKSRIASDLREEMAKGESATLAVMIEVNTDFPGDGVVGAHRTVNAPGFWFRFSR